MKEEKTKMAFGGKYEIKETIGSGVSGNVYKVWDKHLERYMAMKQYLAENKSSFSEWEMKILKELKHPALPMITDYVQTEDGSFLVMEYVEGTSMQKYLKQKGSVNSEKAVKWVLEIATVLDYLHKRNPPIYYRDMKPSNIMIDGEGKIHLIDFGAAYMSYRENEGGAVCAGTFGYAAPEQFETQTDMLLDERCDIYGLGVVFHQMLTGNDPTHPPYLLKPIRSYNRALSGRVEKIIRKATEKDRSKRYQSVMEMEEDIRKYKDKEQWCQVAGIAGIIVYYTLLVSCFLIFWNKANEAGIGDVKKDIQLLETAGITVALCLMKLIWERTKAHFVGNVRMERNIYLSAKKERGLLLIMCGVFGAVLLTESSILAAEDNVLLVNVRNEYGQKLLIRYDALYCPTEDMKLEVPIKELEEGQEYILKLECKKIETGETKSRSFRLKRSGEKVQ